MSIISDRESSQYNHQGDKATDIYQSLDRSSIRCLICARQCILRNGVTADCGARHNENGQILITPGYPVSRSAVVPLSRLRVPCGTKEENIFVIGGWGCNLYCLHCINAKWSYLKPKNQGIYWSSEEIVNRAIKAGCSGIALSITEPLIYLEHLCEALKAVKACSLMTIMCTNGTFIRQSLDRLLPLVDWFRIDLKGFSNRVYKHLTRFSAFERVIENVLEIKRGGKKIALQFVPIPGINDHPLSLWQGLKKMKTMNLTDIPLTMVRFIPSAYLQALKLPDDRYLGGMELRFSKAGFQTTISEA